MSGVATVKLSALSAAVSQLKSFNQLNHNSICAKFLPIMTNQSASIELANLQVKLAALKFIKFQCAFKALRFKLCII